MSSIYRAFTQTFQIAPLGHQTHFTDMLLKKGRLYDLLKVARLSNLFFKLQ